MKQLSFHLARCLARCAAEHSDVLLACAVMAIIGAMIVPLPPWLLDLLLALNLAAAATLLVAALFARDALKVAAFPTLLLITTLFRLALNVSSTRLALLDGRAGEVIQAFGEFVVRGEYVVGAVIFAILTLVQLLVVAKGAERVAEVAARFTLDAMPGKQMSIDADLRAGAIDQAEARRRRRALERESQMYGAMDGAMKFVKGDAIAGLVIVLINSVGGLIVGVLLKGMSAAEAAKTYTLLAIGDGLVSQIPALCVAVSAGLVVTRVSAENDSSSLGTDIGAQFFSQPKALYVVAGLMAALAVLPGMPALPFLALGAAAAAGARALGRPNTAPAAEPGAGSPADQSPQAADSRTEPTAVGVLPICIDLSPALDAMTKEEDGKLLRVELPALRESLFQELGVHFPGVRVRGNAPELPSGGYAIRIDEVPCARGAIDPGLLYVDQSPEEIAFLGVSASPARDPATGRAMSAVSVAALPVLKAAGLRARSARELVLAHLAAVLCRHAATFLGMQELQALLEAIELQAPALVKEVTQRIPFPLLVEIFRKLVDEGVPIRNLKVVLETLVEPGAEGDALALAERARRALRRHLSYRYAGEGPLYAHLLDPEVEEILRRAVRAAGEAGSIALDPSEAVAIIEGLREALNGSASGVVLSSPDVRRYLRKLCEGAFPDVAVLSYGELTADLGIRPLGKVSLRRAA